jgi:hypothetical protein
MWRWVNTVALQFVTIIENQQEILRCEFGRKSKKKKWKLQVNGVKNSLPITAPQVGPFFSLTIDFERSNILKAFGIAIISLLSTLVQKQRRVQCQFILVQHAKPSGQSGKRLVVVSCLAA